MIKNWSTFVNESAFLKSITSLGYVELSPYPMLSSVLKKYQNNTDYMTDGVHLVWNYQNEALTNDINVAMFKTEVSNVFDIDYLKYTREPIIVSPFAFPTFTDLRVNHYLIKSNNSDVFQFGQLKDNSITDFVKTCISKCQEMNLNTFDRYCYITIDQKKVQPGQSQRDFGWHIDGLQGDEVANKELADFQFIWADQTPTKFCTQVFNVSGLDVSVHNVFNWLGKQVEDQFCYILNKNTIYLMNSYHVHTATRADVETYRKFVRLSFTLTPITSVKMTKNDTIEYNYPIHQTTGNIPRHLI